MDLKRLVKLANFKNPADCYFWVSVVLISAVCLQSFVLPVVTALSFAKWEPPTCS